MLRNDKKYKNLQRLKKITVKLISTFDNGTYEPTKNNVIFAEDYKNRRKYYPIIFIYLVVVYMQIVSATHLKFMIIHNRL